jgi:hypothetical protein
VVLSRDHSRAKVMEATTQAGVTDNRYQDAVFTQSWLATNIPGGSRRAQHWHVTEVTTHTAHTVLCAAHTVHLPPRLLISWRVFA